MGGFNNLTFFIGIVENNVDERLEGRVQVRAFGFHGTVAQVPTENLPWAIPISGNYDANMPIPPLNSWVFGFFLDGREAQQPMLLGLMPTQYTTIINPELNGYGRIDVEDYDLKAQGFRPQDYGQPQNSNLARGENLERTYLASIEATKISDVSSASGETWSEPGSAYKAQYPFNRVIQTAGGHSIELDDTPGAERMMFYHNSGSYIQVDTTGTTTNKATNDKYDINENNMHVYVGGRCDVSIMGDAYVKVGGSKIEEVMGDLRQVVHGNYELDVGGFANMNVSDEVQIRGARVAMEGKVEDVTILGAKNVSVGGMESVFVAAGETIGLGGGSQINIKTPTLVAEGSDGVNIKGDAVKIGGGDKVSISASVVALDDVIQLSNGESDEPDAGSDVEMASGTQMVEPTAKAVSGIGGMSQSRPMSAGVVNAASIDDLYDTPIISDCSTNLVDAIKGYEGFSATAYDDHGQSSIGYGTATDNKGEVITEAEATRRLTARISSERAFVKSYGAQKGYSWNDCQVDALASFRYNAGAGNFETLTANGSRSDAEIAAKMLEYNKATKSDGTKYIVQGLVSRRKSESDWFRSGAGLTDTPSDDDDSLMV